MKEINNLKSKKASPDTYISVKILKLNCEFLRNIFVLYLIWLFLLPNVQSHLNLLILQQFSKMDQVIKR